MTAALQKAEDGARLLRAELAEKEAAAAELTVRVDAAEAGVAARAKREEALESLLANQKAALVAAEERAAGLGRQLDGLQSLASAQQQAEKGELVQEIAVQERQLRGHAEREAALLSELEAAKRTQGEAEGAVGQLQLDVKHEQALGRVSDTRRAAHGPPRLLLTPRSSRYRRGSSRRCRRPSSRRPSLRRCGGRRRRRPPPSASSRGGCARRRRRSPRRRRRWPRRRRSCCSSGRST